MSPGVTKKRNTATESATRFWVVVLRFLFRRAYERNTATRATHTYRCVACCALRSAPSWVG